MLNYAIEFCAAALDRRWNQTAPSEKGPSHSSDLHTELEAPIPRWMKDYGIELVPSFPQSRSPARPVSAHPNNGSPPDVPMLPSVTSDEPMQLGRTWLSSEGCQRPMDEGRCIYCAPTGHFQSNETELEADK